MVEDKDCSGKPKIHEDAELEEDSSQTQKELALILEVTQQAVLYQLKSLGMIHKQVKNYLQTFDWEVRLHPLYSSDIAPSDYHLIQSMANAMSKQRFILYEDTKNWVNLWIASNDRVLQIWNPNTA
ncbi:Mariner Mos1 transposase [Eumeta japonica]|uniref:Mariner Mos1 transposase n=1 Tax=Eumeta variegata TaxID=151549 RepID=A0A4C1XRY2_EUMVA|nr:Mariner Mos1 transposase [Eumeta japonica]